MSDPEIKDELLNVAPIITEQNKADAAELVEAFTKVLDPEVVVDVQQAMAEVDALHNSPEGTNMDISTTSGIQNVTSDKAKEVKQKLSKIERAIERAKMNGLSNKELIQSLGRGIDPVLSKQKEELKEKHKADNRKKEKAKRKARAKNRK